MAREARGPDDEWDIELALLERFRQDFENGVRYAESDQEEVRAQEGIAAVLALRPVIMASVAAPGAEGPPE